MADDELASALHSRTQTTSLTLIVKGGRVCTEGPERGAPNRQSIDLKTQWSAITPRRDLLVVIGEEKHPVAKLVEYEGDDADKPLQEEIGWRLNTIPIMLRIAPVDQGFVDTIATDEKPGVGFLRYHPRIQTDDGVVNDQWPYVSASIAMGPANFDLIRDRVLNWTSLDISVVVDVNFPNAAAEGGPLGKIIQWNGENPVLVKRATVVWKRGDWSDDFKQKPQRFARPVAAPPSEHEELMGATKRIEAGMKAIITPLWIIAGVIVIWAALRH